MSLEYITLHKTPAGNVHLRATATTEGIQFKAGGFKYYQIHKTGTKSREDIFQSLERKKPYNLVSRTEEGPEGGGGLKQTKNEHDFLTNNCRLFLVLTLSNKAKAHTDFISFLSLYHYNWTCYKLTKDCSVSALHSHLGNSVSWFPPFSVSVIWTCSLADMEVLCCLKPVTDPDFSYWHQSAHLIYWNFLMFV